MATPLVACMPVYNDYPYCILSIRAALKIVDRIVICNSSDDKYTTRALNNYFANNKQVQLINSSKWLDWINSRNIILKHVQKYDQLWLDANDIYCDKLRDYIRKSISKLKPGQGWAPLNVRCHMSFKTSDGFKSGFLERDPCHFGTKAGTINKWGSTGGKFQGAIPLDRRRRRTAAHGHIVMGNACMYHLHGFGLACRQIIRQNLRDFIKNQEAYAKKGIKSPYIMYRRGGFGSNHEDAAIQKLFKVCRSMAGKIKKTGQKLPPMPQVLTDEINNKEFYEFQYDKNNLPFRRIIKFDGKVIEDSIRQ